MMKRKTGTPQFLPSRHSRLIAMKTFIVALGLFLSSFNANAVSFDRNKASTTVEKEICSDPLLGKLDAAR